MPIFKKKLFKPSFVKNQGIFPSVKSSYGIQYVDSILELKFCHLLEYSDEVVDFLAQPEKFRWVDQGVKFNYTPDFFVQYNSGVSEYIEVKVDQSKISPDLQVKLDSFKNLYLHSIDEKISFRTVFECEINKGYLIKNISFLLRHKKFNVLSKKQIRKIVVLYGLKFSILQAVYVLGEECLASIYSSVLHNILRFDFVNTLFNSLTIVEVNYG